MPKLQAQIEDARESGVSGLAFARSSSLAEQVADALVEGIATDVLKPGQRLVETEIADQMRVSRVPVREALKILEAQGIVVAVPHRGVRVAPLDQKRIEEVREVRTALEVIAVRHAAVAYRKDPSLLAPLDAILARMEARVRRDDWSGPDNLDIAFHREICRAAGNQMVSTFWEAIARHIRIIFGKSVHAHTDPVRLVREHRALRDLLAAGEEIGVAAEIQRHIRPAILGEQAPAGHGVGQD